MIGGKKLNSVKTSDIQQLYSSWEFESAELVVTSCRSILFKQHGINGTLYWTNETLLISCESSSDIQQVINATMYFSFDYNGQWQILVKGQSYTLLNDDDTHYSPIVQTSNEIIFTKASNILRKIMLYELPALADNKDPRYAVIDFSRPKMPLNKDDIIVPIYPIIGDMLNISGDDE